MSGMREALIRQKSGRERLNIDVPAARKKEMKRLLERVALSAAFGSCLDVPGLIPSEGAGNNA